MPSLSLIKKYSFNYISAVLGQTQNDIHMSHTSKEQQVAKGNANAIPDKKRNSAGISTKPSENLEKQAKINNSLASSNATGKIAINESYSF